MGPLVTAPFPFPLGFPQPIYQVDRRRIVIRLRFTCPIAIVQRIRREDQDLPQRGGFSVGFPPCAFFFPG